MKTLALFLLFASVAFAADVTQHAPKGALVSLTVVARGTAPLKYQWLKNGKPIAGATGTLYQLPAYSSVHDGVYSVRVSNAFGSLDSKTVYIVEGKPPLEITVSATVKVQ